MTDAATIEIFGIAQSNFLRAVRMAAIEKSIPHAHHPVIPHSPEAQAVHPLGLVPGLRHGDLTLGESQAIIAYFDGLYPDTPMGPAGSPAEAAEIAEWTSIVVTSVDRVLVRKYGFAHIFPKTADGSPDQAAIEAAMPEVRNVIALLDGRLQDREFLASDRFTFADALLMATLDFARRLPEAASIEAPALDRYIRRHATRASFAETAPALN